MAITFLWIGILIFKSPAGWAGYVQDWMLRLLPIPAEEIMVGTAIFDIVVGVWLLFDWKVWIPSGLAVLHIAIVLTVSGIDTITVRDIGLFAGNLALLFSSMPENIASKFEK